VLRALLLLAATNAMAIDLQPLWDFGNPALSEERFRAALTTAKGDDVLILQTQIARTYGLRRDFARARQMLEDMDVSQAGPEPRIRHALELGRTYASAAHPKESQTPEARARARALYVQAFELAKREQFDALAIDAVHMLAFVDTEPADQLKWAQAALALIEGSSQPAAKRWQASLRNNAGFALHQLGRYDEALAQFQQALRLRTPGTEAARVARWMVAWTLRSLGRLDEALGMQLELERERDAAGEPDPHVFAELELLYRAKGDEGRAGHYAAKRAK
jgi:tetratricopeptide (TPR) repeat protein